MVGPQANVSGVLFGNYAGSANKGSCWQLGPLPRDSAATTAPRALPAGNWGLSLEAALQERLGGGTVTAARGLDAIGAPESRDGFRAAAAAAASADATVVVLGLAFDQYCHGDDDGLGDHCEREGVHWRTAGARPPAHVHDVSSPVPRRQRPAHHRAASRPAEDGRRLACRNGASATGLLARAPRSPELTRNPEE